VPETSCGGLVLACAVAALVVGLVFSAAGGTLRARRMTGSPAPEVLPVSLEETARAQIKAISDGSAGLAVYGFRTLPSAVDAWAGIMEAVAFYGGPRPASPANMPLAAGSVGGLRAVALADPAPSPPAAAFGAPGGPAAGGPGGAMPIAGGAGAAPAPPGGRVATPGVGAALASAGSAPAAAPGAFALLAPPAAAAVAAAVAPPPERQAAIPMGQRTEWMAEWRMMRILERAVCYDQVNVGELAHLDMMARRLQFLEEKAVEQAFTPNGGDEKDRGKSVALDNRVENNLSLGAQESRAMSVFEMEAEADAAKERRKARVERVASATSSLFLGSLWMLAMGLASPAVLVSVVTLGRRVHGHLGHLNGQRDGSARRGGGSPRMIVDARIISAADIQRAFYRAELPSDIARAFSLSRAANRALCMGGMGLDIDVVPELLAGPADRSAAAGGSAAAACVDNSRAAADSQELADRELQLIPAAVSRRRLPVHEAQQARASMIFTGLELDGVRGAMRVTCARLARLRLGAWVLVLRCAVARDFVDGVSRICFSPKSVAPARRFLGGVLRELHWARATLRLWATSWRPPWAPGVAASDSRRRYPPLAWAVGAQPTSPALEGWKKLKMPCMRLPIPRPAGMAIAGGMISIEQLPFATMAAPAKRGSHESVALDRVGWRLLRAALEIARPGGMAPRAFDAMGAREAFDLATEHLGLEAQSSLYVLRRSAASDDLLAARRSFAEGVVSALAAVDIADLPIVIVRESWALESR
ncbi:unnamed protein product, partial [Prorocentrum cordatum]